MYHIFGRISLESAKKTPKTSQLILGIMGAPLEIVISYQGSTVYIKKKTYHFTYNIPYISINEIRTRLHTSINLDPGI